MKFWAACLIPLIQTDKIQTDKMQVGYVSARDLTITGAVCV